MTNKRVPLIQERGVSERPLPVSDRACVYVFIPAAVSLCRTRDCCQSHCVPESFQPLPYSFSRPCPHLPLSFSHQHTATAVEVTWSNPIPLSVCLFLLSSLLWSYMTHQHHEKRRFGYTDQSIQKKQQQCARLQTNTGNWDLIIAAYCQ